MKERRQPDAMRRIRIIVAEPPGRFIRMQAMREVA
jgi:hypothetical protein